MDEKNLRNSKMEDEKNKKINKRRKLFLKIESKLKNEKKKDRQKKKGKIWQDGNGSWQRKK